MEFKRTKIVATVSSLNSSVELLRKLYDAGMNVARLNTAHMTIEEAAAIVRNIRDVSDQIGIMIDTKGPNVRTSDLSAPMELKLAQTVLVSGNPVPDGDGFRVNYARFAEEVKIGQRIVVDDGAVELEVVGRNPEKLLCRVTHAGTVYDKKSVNVPDAALRTPALTRKDREFVDFAVANQLDFIAHSFVRDRDDVMALQSILDTHDSSISIIAKIENRQGVNNLSDILDVAAGVMVARGDLGIEIPLEEVPLIQKNIIYECMRRHKQVITATQMLQSMIHASRPTRAEVSDIANAVLDGTDAVMLSGETAQGDYPVESVAMMSRIIRQTEASPDNLFTRLNRIDDADNPVRGCIVHSVMEASKTLPVQSVICNTGSGRSCNLCSAYRGKVPIFGLTYRPNVARRLSLTYGVQPEVMEYVEDPHHLLKASLRYLLEKNRIKSDDLVAVLGRFSPESSSTDLYCIVRPCDVLADDSDICHDRDTASALPL